MVQIWVLRVKICFLQFLVDIFPLESGPVDLHTFADPEPGSQNLANPTDSDPKHWFRRNFLSLKSLTPPPLSISLFHSEGKVILDRALKKSRFKYNEGWYGIILF